MPIGIIVSIIVIILSQMGKNYQKLSKKDFIESKNYGITVEEKYFKILTSFFFHLYLLYKNKISYYNLWIFCLLVRYSNLLEFRPHPHPFDYSRDHLYKNEV